MTADVDFDGGDNSVEMAAPDSAASVNLQRRGGIGARRGEQPTGSQQWNAARCSSCLVQTHDGGWPNKKRKHEWAALMTPDVLKANEPEGPLLPLAAASSSPSGADAAAADTLAEAAPPVAPADVALPASAKM